MASPLVAVIGTDGSVPIYDPDARWCIWEKSEIWLGTTGLKKYIPKVRDWVIDAELYVVWIVESLDPITLIPSLRELKPGGVSFVLDNKDILLGGEVYDASTFRLYVDTSVLPYTMDIDKRCRVYGSTASSYKIFRGQDLSDTGNVISQKYDSSGNYVGNTIELELVGFNSHDNYAIKAPRTCNGITQMPDGEVVTVVIYDDVGHVVTRQQLLVVNTSFVRPAYAEEKYITAISLESRFLSPAVDNVLLFPLNVPLTGLNLFGRVHYSDGTTLDLPVGDNKFQLFGLDQFVSTIIGQKIELVLSYKLSPGEATYNATTGDGRYLTAAYSLEAREANLSYTVKLFGYPEWIDEYQGYRMRWYLLNLDRNLMKDVTPYVRWSEQTGAYDPLGYGIIQRKAVSLTMSDVSAAYQPFIHVQEVDIVLRGGPDVYDTPWEISQEVSGGGALYGTGLKIERDFNDKKKFTLHSGIATKAEFLDRVYYATKPLVNREREANPPEPTHFEVVYGTDKMRYPINTWQSQLNIGVEIPVFKTAYIKFIRETVSGDMVLAVAAMTVKS